MARSQGSRTVTMVPEDNLDYDDIEKSYAPLKNYPNRQINVEKFMKVLDGSWTKKGGASSKEQETEGRRKRIGSKRKVNSNIKINNDLINDYAPLLKPISKTSKNSSLYSNADSLGGLYGSLKNKPRSSYSNLSQYSEIPSAKHYPLHVDARDILNDKGKVNSDEFTVDEEKNATSALYEWCQRNKVEPVVVYTDEVKARGKSEIVRVTHLCKITLFDSSTVGLGTTKKEAKKYASLKMLDIIKSGFTIVCTEDFDRATNYSDTTRNSSLGGVIKTQDEDDFSLTNNPIYQLEEICIRKNWPAPEYQFELINSIVKCTAVVSAGAEIIYDAGYGRTQFEAKLEAAKNIVDFCKLNGYITYY